MHTLRHGLALPTGSPKVEVPEAATLERGVLATLAAGATCGLASGASELAAANPELASAGAACELASLGEARTPCELAGVPFAPAPKLARAQASSLPCCHNTARNSSLTA